MISVLRESHQPLNDRPLHSKADTCYKYIVICHVQVTCLVGLKQRSWSVAVGGNFLSTSTAFIEAVEIVQACKNQSVWLLIGQ